MMFVSFRDCIEKGTEMNTTDTAGLFPRLLADIGGTNARFAIETAPGSLAAETVYFNRAFPGLEAALAAFLASPEAASAGARRIRHAAMAIANPVTGDQIRMTNSAWTFSIEAVRQRFGLETLLFINDFTALAMALPFLPPSSFRQFGGEKPVDGQPVGLLGAGTGLGVSGLIWHDGAWVPLQTEGGHVTFSPSDEQEMTLLRLAWKQFPHVSAERFLSGMGLELMYRLLAQSRGEERPPLQAPDITARAQSGECPLCGETVALFCRMLGTVAGNLALTLGAGGGIYIGGGIVPRLGECFFASGFRQRFEEKGRFSSYLSRIPVYVVLDTFAAFTGVSAMLERHLAKAGKV